MQVTTVRSKEKVYDIYLKSEKLVHSKQEHEKKCFPAIQKWKKLVPSYFEPDKHCCNYLEREKSGSLLFRDQKMQFTRVRSKEKDYDNYLQSEKIVHSQQGHEKIVSQLFKSGINRFLAISSLTNTVAAIWREKKVDPCYLETKKCSSQQLGARKKIDIYLKSEKLVHSQQEHEKIFPAIWKWEKLVPSYFEPDKHCCSYLEIEKSGSLLFGDQKMQVTTVRRKEKYYDIYLKSEKQVHSQQEHEKNVSQLFRCGKNRFLAISSLTNTVSAI